MLYRNMILSLLMITALFLAAGPRIFTPSPNQLVNEAVNLPDAYMEEVHTMILDKEGKPKLELSVPKMIHFAKHDTTRLISPKLTLYRHSPHPWYVSARYAKASNGIEHIHFWDNVIIHHLADTKSPSTVIKTKTLTVYPEKHTAETPDAITLIQPSMTINALGMFADMNTGDIKLLSEARGEYAPS